MRSSVYNTWKSPKCFLKCRREVTKTTNSSSIIWITINIQLSKMNQPLSRPNSTTKSQTFPRHHHPSHLTSSSLFSSSVSSKTAVSTTKTVSESHQVNHWTSRWARHQRQWNVLKSSTVKSQPVPFQIWVSFISTVFPLTPSGAGQTKSINLPFLPAIFSNPRILFRAPHSIFYPISIAQRCSDGRKA